MKSDNRLRGLVLHSRALVLGLLILPGPACRAATDSESPSGKAAEAAVDRDSTLAAGEQQLRDGELFEAVETFRLLAEAYPEDSHLLTRLGHAHLKRKEYKAARDAFAAAKKLDPDSPEPHFGLGLVHAEMPAKGISAYYNFRRAVGEAKRATKIDSTYAPAYRLLGEAYERFKEDHKRAIKYYTKYVELEPENREGLLYFGLACVQAKQYDRIGEYITPYLKGHPEEVELIPLAAQAFLFEERYELALEYFERYLQNLEGGERRLYTDISFAASGKEMEKYEAIAQEVERLAYLEQFWSRRDPDILTKINERIIEHYRRVWYARTFLSDKVYPWDRRGEVYIRYGEPDYRSRSTEKQFRVSPEVEAVRTKMAVRLYGHEATFLTFTGPVYPIRSTRDPFAPSLFDRDLGELSDPVDPYDEEQSSDEPSTEGEAAPEDDDPFAGKDSRFDEFGNLKTNLSYGDYAPVTLDNDWGTVPWETWTYTQIQGGIEFTFTDDFNNGQFNFAPIPPVTSDDRDIRDASALLDYAPEALFANAKANVPDYYRPGAMGPALSFYFDLASFRGPEGQTDLEVYYGIPPEQIEAAREADSALVHVQCSLALADEGHTAIYRTAEEFFYKGRRDYERAKGSFIPELLKTRLPPGKYELQVQLKDMISGRTGLYKQALKVEDYRQEALQMSDVELASAIQDTLAAEKFRKGEVGIVPMPTRAFAEAQKVHAYYEIYNLTEDVFGQTRYKVQYLVRTGSMPSVGVFGAVATGLRSVFRIGRKPQVSVTYEQAGTEPTEQEYFEIDLSKAKAGVKILEIKVEDLVSGQSTGREIRFRYGG